MNEQAGPGETPQFESSDSSARDASIEGVIHYIDRYAPIGGINDVEREKSTLPLVAHRVRIRDARTLQSRLGLERTGFLWLRHPSPVQDFTDSSAIERVYLPRTAALVKALTGADRVVTFGHVVRDSALTLSLHRPVFNAHVDYDERTVRAVAQRLLGAEEYERREHQRIVLVNVWRPIAPVQSTPLAVCDASSVESGDLVYGPIGGKSAAGVPNASGWNLAYSPKHRWHYLSRMQPGEVLVFKLCDTDRARVQWSAHTGFEDPTSEPDAPPRRSIEVRTLAFVGEQVHRGAARYEEPRI
jgi:hypothetical protein